MSRTTWILIFLGVVALHAGAFFLIKDRPALPPQWFATSPTPEPAFTYQEAKFTDPATGQPMRAQEFTISTQLAEPSAGVR